MKQSTSLGSLAVQRQRSGCCLPRTPLPARKLLVDDLIWQKDRLMRIVARSRWSFSRVEIGDVIIAMDQSRVMEAGEAGNINIAQ